MFTTGLKFIFAAGSILAGVAVAVWLASAGPDDLQFALKLPASWRPDMRSAVEETKLPAEAQPLPIEPAPFYLPNGDFAVRPMPPLAQPTERVELVTHTAPLALPTEQVQVAQMELPPLPPGINVSPEQLNQLQQLLPDLAPPNANPAAAPPADGAVQSHPVPRRNFLAPRNSDSGTKTSTTQGPTGPAANPNITEREIESEVLPPAPQVRRGDGDDQLYINVQNTDIREVLQLISAQGGLNILASKSVEGNVSATLNGVDVQTALSAILKSHGYAARRDGDILYVGTPADLQAIDQSSDQLSTRIYRPNYVSGTDLQKLITPMLTQNVGRITISTPSDVDIPMDKVKTGGDSFGGNEVVMVHDYEAVLFAIDQVMAEIDRRPPQVAIEAMILSVRLSDQCRLGVNFEVLRDKANVRLASGSATADLASLSFTPGSLKLGFLDGSLSGLIDALETVGDTNVIASPRLMVLNKQKAEIQIGEQLGYVNTTVTENASTQSVSFLEVGTLLRLRPFIASDGLIRLEVHPELSTGNVVVQSGLTLPNKSVTQVTTNVMCRDGATVVLGGLIRQDLKNDTKQIPWIGTLPWVGPIFRNKTESNDRVEIIVLLTPRIVGDAVMCEEGSRMENEFSARQDLYFDKMSPLGKRHMGEKHYRLAKAAVAACDYEAALKQINLSLHCDPLNREAVQLREQIVAAGGFEQESVNRYLRQGLAPWSHAKNYTREGYPWKEPAEYGFEPLPAEVPDQGVPTPKANIVPQRPITDPFAK